MFYKPIEIKQARAKARRLGMSAPAQFWELPPRELAKREELETAGLLDQFYTAPYLSTADDIFAPIFAALTDAQKTILDEQCQWGV